ncbi:TfuA-like protein [Myxococcus sp. NMCA1]|uniref:TfuA-like protein n=1 Tax=Myxococcus sp. NMCA1 TaxID=2996785 RepID=UPI002286CC91|nr:TfuA-like protein [Myxococcus sp. NMCA1]WAM28846.1 TfuA-like protein [Myxococcus sp. NMCA1]
MKRRADNLVVFLGPSLPEAEAKRLAPCTVLPPARQGDVWRALRLRPRAIALVDGVFEAQPSVWHHELLAAMEAGVAVFGGGSMGALRAAELAPHGVVGVGRIFEWYRDGVVVDDSEVALLHADGEHGWRPLTVPMVNVRHAAACAAQARVLTRDAARALVDAGQSVFYQERTWGRVLESVAPRWSASTRAAWDAWFPRGAEDLKRQDALACLRTAAEWVASGAPAPHGAPREPSSLVRRRRLVDDVTATQAGAVSSGQVLDVLRESPDAPALAEAGLRRALLAGWARTLGLGVSDAEVAVEEARWWQAQRVPASRREAHLARLGLDAVGLRRLCEELALERLVLTHSARLLPDGPSWDEALAAEARLSGAWADAAEAVDPTEGVGSS